MFYTVVNTEACFCKITSSFFEFVNRSCNLSISEIPFFLTGNSKTCKTVTLGNRSPTLTIRFTVNKPSPRFQIFFDLFKGSYFGWWRMSRSTGKETNVNNYTISIFELRSQNYIVRFRCDFISFFLISLFYTLRLSVPTLMHCPKLYEFKLKLAKYLHCITTNWDYVQVYLHPIIMH